MRRGWSARDLNGGPRRILHVGTSLDLAGTEALVMGAYRATDRSQIQFDFLVPEGREGAYSDEVRSLGGRIFSYPRRSTLRRGGFGRAFERTLREDGPFAGVHSHVYLRSGPLLQTAAHARVGLRIAHSHFTDDGRQNSASRGAYRAYARWLIDRHATHKLGCSRLACESLFGAGCWRDPRTSVVLNGIDLERFAAAERKAPSLRHELGLSEDAVLIGHVGRFTTQKNHRLLVEIFADLASRVGDAALILVGTGPLREETERHATSLGLRSRVHFMGARTDTAHVLAGLDVLVVPSLYEGLPVVVVEAQAAGLPSVISDTITREVDLGVGLVRFVGLGSGAPAWTNTIVSVLRAARPDRARPEALLRAAGYDIADVARALTSLYLS